MTHVTSTFWLLLAHPSYRADSTLARSCMLSACLYLMKGSRKSCTMPCSFQSHHITGQNPQQDNYANITFNYVVANADNPYQLSVVSGAQLEGMTRAEREYRPGSQCDTPVLRPKSRTRLFYGLEPDLQYRLTVEQNQGPTATRGHHEHHVGNNVSTASRSDEKNKGTGNNSEGRLIGTNGLDETSTEDQVLSHKTFYLLSRKGLCTVGPNPEGM